MSAQVSDQVGAKVLHKVTIPYIALMLEPCNSGIAVVHTDSKFKRKRKRKRKNEEEEKDEEE